MDEEEALLRPETIEPKPLRTWTWQRFVPGSPEFWERHLGTDMLVASWLLLISTCLWVAVELEIIFSEDVSKSYINLAHWSIVATGILFVIGAYYFVLMSYPEEIQRMAVFMKGAHNDPADLTCMQKYFTGTDLLIATWFFYIAALPVMIYGLYMIAVDPTMYVGYVYVVGCLAFFAVTAIWLIGAMPENMIANEGMGSSYFYDFFAHRCCGICIQRGSATDEYLRVHIGSDVMFGMWLFTLMSFLGIPWGIYEIFFNDYDVIGWLDFSMAFTFALGMAILTYTSYPGNMESHFVWDVISCKGLGKERLNETSAAQ